MDDDIVASCRCFMSYYTYRINLMLELLDLPLDENNLIALARHLYENESSWYFTLCNYGDVRHLLNEDNALFYAKKICNTKNYLQWKNNIHAKENTPRVCSSKIPYCTFAYGMFLTKNNVRDFAIFVSNNLPYEPYSHHQTFRTFLDTLPTSHEYSPKSFYEFMYDYIAHNPNTLEMHNWLSTHNPYRQYVRNFPPLKVRVSAIYEQNGDVCCNKKRKRWDVAELVFMDEYLVKNVCDMLDISRD